jgi:HSP20 family protein
MVGLAKREVAVAPPVDFMESFGVFGSVDRAFERMFEMWPAFLPVRRPEAVPGDRLTESYIPVNEYYRDGSLLIRADIPGIDPDTDVDVTVAAGTLHIKAERRQEEKVEEEHYLRREIRHGSFERTLPLPEGVTEKDIRATYKDGILEIMVPKAELEPARKVAISKS